MKARPKSQRSPRRSAGWVRSDLQVRLGVRRQEIEDAILTRVLAVSDPPEALGPEYADGFRAAVRNTLDYCLAAIGLDGRLPPLPPALLGQARLAAHNRVSLDTVLRRCVAAQALLSDFLVEEAEASGVGFAAMQRLLRIQAALADRVIVAVSDEYTRESERRSSIGRHHDERIERLLAGEPLDTSGLNYDFTHQHLGAVGKGSLAAETIRSLAAGLDCRLLLVERGDGIVWAWLGGRRHIDYVELESRALPLPVEVSLAWGEPARGLNGWRLTHRQAGAALPIALRGPKGFVRYADVALIASVSQDDLLATSLRALFLAPLRQGRDGGRTAFATLRAYLAAGRNISSAAAGLGVSRRTVSNRLTAIEDRLGRPLADCAAELEVVLRLQDLDRA